MQLKRDTDYALRILMCAAEQKKNKKSFSGGLTIQEISARTGMPRVSVDRICRCLEKSKLIVKATGVRGENVYFADDRTPELSLLEIIEAVEKETQLFAVFDKKSDMYRMHEAFFREVQLEIEKTLSEATVEKITNANIFHKKR